MNALTKSAAALAAVALFSSVAPAQAGMGPCMPMMMMSGGGASGCNNQPAPQEKTQACPVPEKEGAQASGCAGNAQMAGMMGDMAANGMGIAMAVMGAIFGPAH
ncbi:MAG: hypothetical protein HGA75_00885, partial [Thiobacillus sp.]|nr:hypothetical protein [Thiobacillus sp.]